MSGDGAADAVVRPTAFQPSVFLDGSVLMSLYQFWDACKSANAVDRLHELSKWKDLEEALKSAKVHVDHMKLTDDISRGMNAFQSLKGSLSDHHHFSSRVCWSELHHTLLEARGLEGLVHRRVPHSLRVKRPQMLYRVALQKSDYDELSSDIETFRESLREYYDLDVIDVEDPTSGSSITPRDIWDDAQDIWSHVLMDVLDAYVCAAAIRIQAASFLTGNPILRDALTPLYNPDSEWAATVESLRRALGLAPDAILPQPLTPRAALGQGLATT